MLASASRSPASSVSPNRTKVHVTSGGLLLCLTPVVLWANGNQSVPDLHFPSLGKWYYWQPIHVNKTTGDDSNAKAGGY
ncbi:MAG: hypothetical protein ACTS7D_01055 [Candidatus Hodgkinia cicadicola]